MFYGYGSELYSAKKQQLALSRLLGKGSELIVTKPEVQLMQFNSASMIPLQDL
jgi:hypothetical protein